MRQAFTVAEPRHAALRALNYEPRLEAIRSSRQGTVALNELVVDIGDSYGSVFASIECAPAHGVELLSQREMFRAEPEGKWIRRDCLPRPDAHLIRRWQVLIAGTGTLAPTELYGRCILADERLVGKYLGPDGLALTFREAGSDINLYAYAFLSSSIGLAAIRSLSAGTKLLRPRLDMLAQLRVPVPRDGVVRRVADLVRKCVEQRELYMRELLAARSVIEELPEIREVSSSCAGRRPQATMWTGSLQTLCAWNAASAGDALAVLKRRCSGRLGDVVPVDGIFYGPRFGRTTCVPPHGFDFMSQRDLFLIRPVPRRIAHPGFDDAKLFVQPDTVLVAAQGTLGEGEIFGRAMLARGQFARTAYTQHVLRIASRQGYGSQLFAYLSTLVGLRLLRSTAVGTKLLGMREDLLRDLPIPDLESKARGRVARHVDTAFTSREEAASAELEAIRIVEEEVLPAWLA